MCIICIYVHFYIPSLRKQFQSQESSKIKASLSLPSVVSNSNYCATKQHGQTKAYKEQRNIEVMQII